MNFNLREHTFLLAIGGSRAYGIHTDASDVDLQGCAFASKEIYLGFLNNFEQADGSESMEPFFDLLTEDEQRVSRTEKLEGCVYEVKKFMALAMDCNPTVLQPLYVPDCLVRFCTKSGEILRENRHLFLSLLAKSRLCGYSFSQFGRIERHRGYLLNPPQKPPERKEFDLKDSPELKRQDMDVAFAEIKKRLDSWEVDFAEIESESQRLALREKIETYLVGMLSHSDSKWLSAGRSLGYSDNFLILLEKERKFRAAQEAWAKYHSWKANRNPKRAGMEAKFGYDLKHATQLVRLMRMCKELLTTGEFIVDRTGIDADELRAIKSGAWTYDQLKEWFGRVNEECEILYKSGQSPLPYKPDRIAIDRLCQQLLEEFLRGNCNGQ